MTLWAAVVLILALVGTTMNLLLGTPFERTLHDIILFLLALGILARIRYQRKKAEKETTPTQQGDEEPSSDEDSAPEEAEKE
jgi:hypothetical protein